MNITATLTFITSAGTSTAGYFFNGEILYCIYNIGYLFAFRYN